MRTQSTWRERLSYRFDNYMSRGTLALIGGLGLVVAAVILAAAGVLSLCGPGVAPEGGEGNLGFWEAAWQGLMHSIDSGAVGADSGWGYRAVMFLVTLGGIFVLSALVGVLTSGVEAKLEELRKGRSRVLEEGHTVVLGWSAQVFTVVPELIEANASAGRGVVVILAPKDKVEMEEELRTRIGDFRGTRVICRSGSPVDPADLELANPRAARSIVILPPEEGDADASVIKTTLALTNGPNRRPEPYTIVTQIDDERNLEVVRMIGARDRLLPVLTGDIIARVTAQTSRQSGLSTVYTELLDFEGDEIYFKEEAALVGRTYGDAILAYEDSAVIGLVPAGGRPGLNPPMGRVIGPGDRLIAISADDDTIRVAARPGEPDPSLVRAGGAASAARPERCLLLGWNDCAPVIIRELDSYVAPGSVVAVVAGVEYASAVELMERPERQELSFRAGDTTDRALLEGLGAADYDHIIVLADKNLGVQEADSRTLVTLLHLRDIAEHDATPFSIVSEMLDLRNRELAEAAKVDDFIVSDNLISLMIAQLSENGELLDVFAELFSPEGSEIYLRPVRDYVAVGASVDFYTVAAAARDRGETAIGYRVLARSRDAGGSYGVRTNPPKSEKIRFADEDQVIVLAGG